MLVLFLLYVLFSFLVAYVLKNKTGGFWLMFGLSLLFTPILVGFLGLIFSDKTTASK